MRKLSAVFSETMVRNDLKLNRLTPLRDVLQTISSNLYLMEIVHSSISNKSNDYGNFNSSSSKEAHETSTIINRKDLIIRYHVMNLNMQKIRSGKWYKRAIKMNGKSNLLMVKIEVKFNIFFM